MSKVSDILTSDGFASADDARKAQLTKAVTDLEVILKDSGFNVLLNKSGEGADQEFVPGARIKEVTAQKHTLANDVVTLNKELKKMKKIAEANDDPDLVNKLDAAIKANIKLKTANLEQDTNYQIKLAAMALKPYNVDDFVALINKDAIQNVEGTMIGLDSEMARLAKDKAYMLKGEKDDDHNNETHDRDNNQHNEHNQTANFNDMIRSAAGKGRAKQ